MKTVTWKIFPFFSFSRFVLIKTLNYLFSMESWYTAVSLNGEKRKQFNAFWFEISKWRENLSWNSITQLKSAFEFNIFVGLFNCLRLSSFRTHWIIHLDRGVRFRESYHIIHHQITNYVTTYLATVRVPPLLSSPNLFFGGIRSKSYDSIFYSNMKF